MNVIKETGYYLSEPFHYEDLHAGNVIKKDVYTALWFRQGDIAMTFSKSNNSEFSKQELLNEKRKADLLMNNDEIKLIFDKGSIFEVVEKFTLISPEKLRSKSGTDYHFVPW